MANSFPDTRMKEHQSFLDFPLAFCSIDGGLLRKW